MFGWIKKRERREHIKLLKQNELAASYLADTQDSFISAGLSNDEGLASTLRLLSFTANQYLFDLESYRIMPPERFNEQIGANRNLRRLFDEVMVGKTAFARQFGTASEKLETFDRKFVPNETWKIFLDAFPTSMEEKFKGN